MSEQLLLGPYRHIALDDGTSVPFYMMPYDKRGICTGPQTLAELLTRVRAGNFTDIFLFAHGWNTDWQSAVRGYEGFQRGFMQMRARHGLPMHESYKPLMIGVFWPSAALVSGADEVGPDFAAGSPEAMDAAVAQERMAVYEVAADLPDEQARRFYELVQKESLTQTEALELANIAQTIYQAADDELQIEEPQSPADVLAVWRAAAAAMEPRDDIGDFEDIDSFEEFEDVDAGPDAAGGLGDFDPRNVVRLLTVYKMKDRAGGVGAGVGSMLADLLAASDAALHLVGHSYGCKVMLSAICTPATLARPVTSLLLLQPAVNHLCFADQVPNANRAGGYRSALARVKQPILSTYSDKDFPLHDTFHLALRRKRDLGELRIAAAGEPPSRFAALGGYGPRHCGEQLIPIHDVNEPYDLTSSVEVIGLDGSRAIDGHGGIHNESVWWALYEQVRTRS